MRKKIKRQPNPGFMRPLQADEALAAVVGTKPLPRVQVVKRLWAYIREHDLQDPRNRRMINADAKLRAVFFGKDQVSMLEMTKLVNKHLSAVSQEEGKGFWDRFEENALAESYAKLGCSLEVSDEELQRKYRELCRQYHPDRVGLPSPGDSRVGNGEVSGDSGRLRIPQRAPGQTMTGRQLALRLSA